jgi:AcrR family transcriptional regulator
MHDVTRWFGPQRLAESSGRHIDARRGYRVNRRRVLNRATTAVVKGSNDLARNSALPDYTLPAKADGGRRRGRPSSAETARITDLILRAATAIFMTSSFAETSIEAVAAGAGVKKDTVYKRFSDKKTLLRAVVQRRVQKWRATGNLVPSGDSLEERLKSYSVALLSYAISDEGRTWIGHVQSAWPGIDGINNRHEVMGYDNALRSISREIRNKTAGDEQPASNPEFVAMALMAILTGWTDTTGWHAEVSEAEVAQFAYAAVELVLGGRASW